EEEPQSTEERVPSTEEEPQSTEERVPSTEEEPQSTERGTQSTEEEISSRNKILFIHAPHLSPILQIDPLIINKS
ncbi:hypothetical protein, partial [Rummeliibacillus suwonensis]|uniref:hypothetical protein n=1 Tax=Rummeliibacillus suwonensis TaxID=1306154 RepID=UPI0028979402